MKDTIIPRLEEVISQLEALRAVCPERQQWQIDAILYELRIIEKEISLSGQPQKTEEA